MWNRGVGRLGQSVVPSQSPRREGRQCREADTKRGQAEVGRGKTGAQWLKLKIGGWGTARYRVSGSHAQCGFPTPGLADKSSESLTWTQSRSTRAIQRERSRSRGRSSSNAWTCRMPPPRLTCTFNSRRRRSLCVVSGGGPRPSTTDCTVYMYLPGGLGHAPMRTQHKESAADDSGWAWLQATGRGWTGKASWTERASSLALANQRDFGSSAPNGSSGLNATQRIDGLRRSSRPSLRVRCTCTYCVLRTLLCNRYVQLQMLSVVSHGIAAQTLAVDRVLK